MTKKRIIEISLSFRNEPIQSRDDGLVVHIYNAETFEQDLNKEDYPGVDFFEFSKTELAAGKVNENTGSGHATTTVQLYPSNITTDKEYYILIIWERFSTRILSYRLLKARRRRVAKQGEDDFGFPDLLRR